MIILKYDLITAVQCGYTDKPDHVMKEQGYSWLSVVYSKNVNFYEVENILYPLPPFLEASDIVDGRFDPRTAIKRVIPAWISFDDSVVHHEEDPTVMTLDYEPKVSTNSIMVEERDREDIQGTKAKKASTTRK